MAFAYWSALVMDTLAGRRTVRSEEAVAGLQDQDETLQGIERQKKQEPEFRALPLEMSITIRTTLEQLRRGY